MLIEIAVLITCLLAFLQTLFNSHFLRHVKNEPHLSTSSVAVLLPMRDEAENVATFIEALRKQEGLKNVSFHCLDDQSSDGTFELLLDATKDDSRFHLHTGLPLPQGWIGKPFALQQALDLSVSEFVVIIDADVRLKPHAIANALKTLELARLDFLSAYPQQIALTWAERITQPLLQWSWLSTVPLRLAEKLGNSSFAVANGQFFIVRREALEAIGGFSKISDRVLDDIHLARLCFRSGFHGTVTDASDVASCRMYGSWSEIAAGYGKSLKTAFRSPVGFAISIIFLFCTGPAPVLLAFTGSRLGIISLSAVIASRAVSAASSGGKIRDSFLQPLSTATFIYLIGYSFLKRDTILWKGRHV